MILYTVSAVVLNEIPVTEVSTSLRASLSMDEAIRFKWPAHWMLRLVEEFYLDDGHRYVFQIEDGEG